MTVEAVVEALRAKGFVPSAIEAGGDVPTIRVTIEDMASSIDFYRCEAIGCAAIEFAAEYEFLSGEVPLEAINDWNASTVLGEAVIGPNQVPRLEYGVLVTGLGPDGLARVIDEWREILLEFDVYTLFGMDTGAASGGGIQQGAATAMATIDVCNESGDEVSVAYATAAGTINEAGETLFRSQGWRNVPHGECQVLWEGPFENRYYYVFARASDGTYGGDYYFCTLQERFEIVETQCDENYEREGFLQIDMAEGSRMSEGFQLNLTP